MHGRSISCNHDNLPVCDPEPIACSGSVPVRELAAAHLNMCQPDVPAVEAQLKCFTILHVSYFGWISVWTAYSV